MTAEEQIIAYSKQGLSKAAAAALMGMTEYSFAQALEVMGFKWPPSRVGRLVIDGVEGTIANHAKRLGVTRCALRGRLRRTGDHPVTEQVYTPVSDEEVDKFIQLRLDGVPAWQAAQMIGRPYNSLRKHAAKRPGYNKALSKVKRKRRSPEELANRNQGFLPSKEEPGDEAA